MSISAISGNHISNSQAIYSSLGQTMPTPAPIGDLALGFIQEKPFLTSGAVFTFGTFITSLLNSKLSSIFGIPALLSFIYEIFFTPDTVAKVVQQQEEKPIKQTVHNCPPPSSPSPFPPRLVA